MTTAPSLEVSVALEGGGSMPRVGLGVFRDTPEQAYTAVREALAAGYRHIDTAQIYRNEAAVGQAVRDSGVPRAEMFVTSKLWNDDQRAVRLDTSVARSVEALGLGPPGLFLLHWVLLKSTRPERIRENLALWDFALDAAQMATLDALEENLVTGWNPQQVA